MTMLRETDRVSEHEYVTNRKAELLALYQLGLAMTCPRCHGVGWRFVDDYVVVRPRERHFSCCARCEGMGLIEKEAGGGRIPE